MCLSNLIISFVVKGLGFKHEIPLTTRKQLLAAKSLYGDVRSQTLFQIERLRLVLPQTLNPAQGISRLPVAPSPFSFIAMSPLMVSAMKL